MKLLACLCLFLAAASAQNLNPSEFLAQIVRVEGTGENVQNTLVSLGVLVADRPTASFVITTATAIRGIDRAQLRVFLQSTTRLTSSDIRAVEEISEHSNFNVTNPLVNNIAILRLPRGQGDNVRTAPRNVASLSATNCVVFPFTPGVLTVSTLNVTVRTTECMDNQPFCAQHQFPVEVSGCSEFIGSPVICQNQNDVAGFANQAMNCEPLGSPVTGRMTFLSMDPFNGWIRQITGSADHMKISMLLVLLGVAIGRFLM